VWRILDAVGWFHQHFSMRPLDFLASLLPSGLRGEPPMKLTTRYLGLTLEHPFMPGASPLADTLDSVRQLEDAGASAIVMRSLFEEQILRERFGGAGFAFGPDRYLEHLRRIKACVEIPVIASINGTTTEGWLKYARLLQRADADALELNFYHLATDPQEDGAAVESRLIDMVAVLKESITIPLAVKLSPFYSSLPNLAARLDSMGVQGLVLFNRFYQPDIDPAELETMQVLRLSSSGDLLLRLRWLAILSSTFRGSLAITGGVHQPIDAVKAVMAGAGAVQMVSALLGYGPNHLRYVREGFERWCEEQKYESIDQLRGAMSLARASDPRGFERRSYVRILQSWRPAG
jgi:dihydroorotate dehydrogenase (fumarate)